VEELSLDLEKPKNLPKNLLKNKFTILTQIPLMPPNLSLNPKPLNPKLPMLLALPLMTRVNLSDIEADISGMKLLYPILVTLLENLN